MKPSKVQKRPRFSPGQRGYYLSQYRQSGLTQGEFVHRHGLKLSTFQRWLYRMDSPAPAQTAFQEVAGLPALAGPAWAAEVGWSHGGTLRLSAGASPELIAFLLQELHAAVC